MFFDIQKFAEEDTTSYGDILDGNTKEIPDELPAIPKELDGLPEDIARDIMSRAEEKSAETAPAPESSKPESSGETSVSYKRFKETLDQKNELEQQLAAYREKYGNASAQSPSQNSPQPQATKQDAPQQPRQPQLNAATMKQIDDVINQLAMEVSGLSKEDVDGIDYLEDDDPRNEKTARRRIYISVLTNACFSFKI